DLVENHVLGRTIGQIYVIEFQKRGLPHAHILLILHPEDKITNSKQVDLTVSAEIQSKEKYPHLHEIVKKCMMHGPCGESNPNSPCMVDGKCSKKFPKEFCEETILENNTYPVYKRSASNPDNKWVVPYNPYLSTKYNCHINVEVCNFITAVKYLFKYVYKGHDKSLIKIDSNEQAQSVSDLKDNKLKENDEIEKFRDMRYLSAPECIWRLFHFNLNDQFPKTKRLPVHLPDQQTCFFKDNESIEKIKNLVNNTELTAYFQLNKELNKEKSGSAQDYFYYEIPKTDETIIGRMYFVHPNDIERFALRILLIYKKGAESFEDLRTVNGIIYSSFFEAAQKSGHLESNSQWTDSLEEACLKII
ncbi:unnamed protein product, partial [Brachionus calyciflorus]